MEVEEEIKQRMFERYHNAHDVEIVQCINSTDNEDVYFIRVVFHSDYDINYIVLTYGEEYLDFFKFEFALPRMEFAERNQLGMM